MGKTNRLQELLNLAIESAGFENANGSVTCRLVGDGRAALGAEESVDIVSRVGLAGPLLDGAVDGQLVPGDDGDESWPGIELAIVST